MAQKKPPRQRTAPDVETTILSISMDGRGRALGQRFHRAPVAQPEVRAYLSRRLRQRGGPVAGAGSLLPFSTIISARTRCWATGSRQIWLRALAMDNGSADAQVALGAVLFLGEWDWVGAERSLRRALEINPDHTEKLLQYGSLH